MKKITLLTAIAMIGFTVSTFGQEASANGDATATILKPITITKGNVLTFGSIVPDADGTVAISTTGTATVSGARLIETATTSAGSFLVTGEAGAAFTVSLPTSATLSNGDATPVTMTVDKFVSDHDEAKDVLTDNAGTAESTFNVGATLNLDAGQAAGTYTGQYEVTVQYL